jgi:PHD/YefM family antitoxin component YafN of YafNO toxin-antitoxin module
MFHLSDVRPLSDFKRSQSELLQHLKTTRRPLLLTLNGRAEVVIQDAAAYQRLLELAAGQNAAAAPVEPERADTVRAKPARRR